MKTKDAKKSRYKGGPSEIMDPVVFEGYEIKVLRHGNTNHVLYRGPRSEDFAPQWSMSLETAKKGVLKWREAGSPDPATIELSTVESGTT